MAVSSTPLRQKPFACETGGNKPPAPVGNRLVFWLTQLISSVKHHEEACSGCSVRLIIIRGTFSPSRTEFWTANLLRLIP